jgi:hypothetical protein
MSLVKKIYTKQNGPAIWESIAGPVLNLQSRQNT